MKTRKNISSLIVLLFLTLMLSTSVEAQKRQAPKHQRQAPKHLRHQVSRTPQTQAVGAPLDGGLLALLAGAGITYFAARKKKKNNM